jgi:hypothetical protein
MVEVWIESFVCFNPFFVSLLSALCLLSPASCLLFSFFCLLPTVYCLLPTTYCFTLHISLSPYLPIILFVSLPPPSWERI